VARWAARKVDDMPAAPERTWRPSLLVPVSSTDEFMGSYRLVRALAGPKGAVRCVGIHPPGSDSAIADLPWMIRGLHNDGIDARCLMVEHEGFTRATRSAMELLGATFFRPNTLFISRASLPSPEDLEELCDCASELHMGLVFVEIHPTKGLGREQSIAVWLRDQSPNWSIEGRQGHLDLSMLLAYQLARSWQGQIHLCTAVANEADRAQAEAFLRELVELSRLGRMTEISAYVGDFPSALRNGPVADLNVLGLPKRPTSAQLDGLLAQVNGSCILVQASGYESILA
jgi:hypothetical protein